MQHRAVVKTNEETTEMSIVYDASGRENIDSPSLNDCLHSGSALSYSVFLALYKLTCIFFILITDLKESYGNQTCVVYTNTPQHQLI